MATSPYQMPTTLGTKRNDGFDPNDVFEVIRKEKDPAIGNRINNLFGTFDGQSGLESGAQNEFAAAFRGNDGKAREFTAQEEKSATDYFNGQIQSRLDALRTNRKVAAKEAAGRALQQVNRGLSTLRLGLPTGGGAAGSSSYLAKLAQDKEADVAMKLSLDDSDQERADFDALSKTQLALRGLRTSAMDELARRGLVPAQESATAGLRMGALLQALMQMQQANNFYGLGQKEEGVGIDQNEQVLTKFYRNKESL